MNENKEQAAANIDLNKLEALARAAKVNGAWPFHEIAFRKAADPATVLQLIDLARRSTIASSGAAGARSEQRVLTQAAFEEIAASWDGCEGEGCDDIGAALRHDFDRLARAGQQAGEAATHVTLWEERTDETTPGAMIVAMESEIYDLRAQLASAQKDAEHARTEAYKAGRRDGAALASIPGN